MSYLDWDPSKLPGYTPIVEEYFGQKPEVAYQYAYDTGRSKQGRGFADYFKRSFQTYQNKYLSDLFTGAVDPINTSWYDWLKSSQFNPYADFSKLSPTDRGERPSVFQSRGRWVTT
jgi:hypothetical protein